MSQENHPSRSGENRRFLVGLIGQGIGASGSPAMHENEGQALGLRVFYQLMDLDRPGRSLQGLLDAAEMAGFAGVNITHPCKQAVIPLLDRVSGEATSIGAVNTVVFRDSQRCGYNTDCYGFAEGFRRGLPDVALREVVQLGAGGAGCAVAHAALELGIERLLIFDQQEERAAQLAEKLGSQFSRNRVCAIADISSAMRTADGLIHATPMGMAAHPGTAIPAEWLRPAMWVSEIVYFPMETELLRAARKIGCRTLDGGRMAVFQAAKAFELFTGIAPDAERMLTRFYERMQRG